MMTRNSSTFHCWFEVQSNAFPCISEGHSGIECNYYVQTENYREGLTHSITYNMMRVHKAF